jgi:hypothetical protein
VAGRVGSGPLRVCARARRSSENRSLLPSARLSHRPRQHSKLTARVTTRPHQLNTNQQRVSIASAIAKHFQTPHPSQTPPSLLPARPLRRPPALTPENPVTTPFAHPLYHQPALRFARLAFPAAIGSCPPPLSVSLLALDCAPALDDRGVDRVDARATIPIGQFARDHSRLVWIE